MMGIRPSFLKKYTVSNLKANVSRERVHVLVGWGEEVG
jgi:hypothetical protein